MKEISRSNKAIIVGAEAHESLSAAMDEYHEKMYQIISHRNTPEVVL